MTALVVMTAPPQPGWEGLIGTYWTLKSDGRTLTHTTERQTFLSVKLKERGQWEEFWALAPEETEDVAAGETP